MVTSLNQLAKLDEHKKELFASFDDLTQCRTDFALEKFVVGQHCFPARQFHQIVIELKLKYYNIKRLDISKRKLQFEIKAIKNKKWLNFFKPSDQFKIEEKELDLEEIERTINGSMKEFSTLYKMYSSFDHKYTNDELNAEEDVYWKERINRQVMHGQQERISGAGKGDLEALSQMETNLNQIENGDKRTLQDK